MECSGSAVRSRHCPATVSGDLPAAICHCSQKEREGAAGEEQPASQETGSTRLMSALSRAKEDTCPQS